MRTTVFTAFLALAMVFSASVAKAGIIAPQHHPPTVEDGWQAGTCYKDTPTCSIDTPSQFFEQSAGHPQAGFTQFIVEDEPGPSSVKSRSATCGRSASTFPPG
jgi:hypothetical protein